ncbi:uncharacterized protein LOC117170758 [Belonocnema kinseyi]|uniref:uncharacterized protein LOC117170758 n=1 Tax=Belonocnema kinseyi TaxID=2817044 RepID=UPI00143D6DE2|nr:uncharacterized protein LOC117170758 [Belonocnema kinseyi]
MKVVTLFFVCVALTNFAKIGAMNNSSRTSTNPFTATVAETTTRHIHATNYPAIHPDIGDWTKHRHTHPTRILTPVPNKPNLPAQQIRIQKVIDGNVPGWHLLQGELMHDYEIMSCHGPHGYAMVELTGRERFYACLKPYLYHNETKSREHTGGPQVYLAYVLLYGKPRMEADLAPRDETSALDSRGLLFHGRAVRNHFNVTQSLGRVRYVLPNNSEVEGDLYEYPGAPIFRT